MKNNKQKTIIFDCDDVLANMRNEMIRVASTAMDRPVSVNELNTDRINNYMEDNDLFTSLNIDQLKREKGSAIITHYLKAMGWSIHMVTARSGFPQAAIRTRDWLIKNDILIDELYVVHHHESKRDILSTLGPIDLYVEDNHNHVEAAHDLPNVKNILIMDRPWNTHVNVGTRIKTLDDVLTFILTTPRE